jgi:hypothetical protein
MRIELYFICWQESEILPLVIKHYQKFVDRTVMYDNHSTDNSREIADSMGCEVRLFGEPGQLNDQHYLDVKNHCWKGSTADYVIVCDCDEILLPGIPVNSSPLQYYKDQGVTVLKTQGWQIISNEMPVNDITEITNGWAFDNYSKSIVFDPQAIKEIQFNPGAHKIAPVGNVVYSDDPLYLLHYRQLGGVDRLINRYRAYQGRRSNHNKRTGHGCHYGKPEHQIRSDWNKEMAIAKPLF